MYPKNVFDQNDLTEHKEGAKVDAQKHLFDNKKMAALLIPLAIDQLLNSFMGTVDTLVVSNLGSANYFSGDVGGFHQYSDRTGIFALASGER